MGTKIGKSFYQALELVGVILSVRGMSSDMFSQVTCTEINIDKD